MSRRVLAPAAARRALVASALALACAVPRLPTPTAAGARSFQGEDPVATLRTADSLREGDAELLAALEADAVVLLPGVPMVRGHALALEAVELAGLAAPRPMHPHARRVVVNAAGDMGYTMGIARATSGRVDRYLAVWRRRGDGEWRVAAYVEAPGPGLPTVRPDSSRLARLRGWPRRDEASARTPAGEMARTDVRFSDDAQRSGIASAFQRYAAPDGVLFPDTAALVVGPEGIGESMRRGPSGVTLVWRPDAAAAAPGGDMGFTAGTWRRESRSARGGVSRAEGKYLTVWRRQPDGRMRYLADMGNGGS